MKEKSVIPHYKDVSLNAHTTSNVQPNLNEQFPKRHVKAHQIPRIRRHNLHVFPANILRSSAHSRLYRLPCRVHEQFRKPFKDLLNLLRVGLLQVLYRELDANVADTSCDFSVRLERGKQSATKAKTLGPVATYQAQESVRIILLLLPPAAVGLTLGAELLAHSGAVVIHLVCVEASQY